MKHFQPATYICARCNVEHCGDANALPNGWGILRTLHGDRNGTPVCGDCATASGEPRTARRETRPTSGMLMGIVAARFSGALIRASDLPAQEPHP